MSDMYKGELQDNMGNTIYPHTDADIVFCADGKTVQEKLAKQEDAIGNVTGVTSSLEVSDPKLLLTSEAGNAIHKQLTSDNGQNFKFAYDAETGKYGYYVTDSEGADTFCPFSSKKTFTVSAKGYSGTSDSNNVEVSLPLHICEGCTKITSSHAFTTIGGTSHTFQQFVDAGISTIQVKQNFYGKTDNSLTVSITVHFD